MNPRTLLIGLMLFLSIQPGSVGDDTDIYVDARPTSDAEPLVFLTLDYRSNLGSTLCTQVDPPDPESSCGVLLGEAYDGLTTGPGSVTLFDGMRAVFRTLFDELAGVKVALVMSHDDSCSGQSSSGGPTVTGCSNGGYILKGLQSFDENDANGAKADMLAALEAIPVPQGNLSHPYQGKEMYFEMFRYLTGQRWHNAHLGWNDFGTNGSENLDDDNPLLSWDPSIESGSSYITPFTDSDAFTCSQGYAVNIMFQVTNQDSDADNVINTSIANGGMDLGMNNPSFNNVLSYMYQTDLAPNVSNGTWPVIDGNQNLQSYIVAAQVNNSTNGYASAGGTLGAIPLTDPAALLDDLRVIFNEILSVSTTFVAASVPVNVFNRSDIVDNVFMAQFAVDPDRRPYWNGNLKKLKIEESTDEFGTTTLSLVDARGADAIAADGRIGFDALTYWTDAASLPPAEELEVELRDGRSVVRGGAGQQIPGFLPGTVIVGDDNGGATRTLYTEPASGNTLINLGVSNATDLQADLGAASTGDAETLIRWIRGQDVDDLDLDGETTEAREWIFGPPLHSRPLPLNYGARTSGYTENNPDIRVFVGADDGFMRSIRNTDSSGNESGVEDWAFMPRGVMDKMSTLRTNSPSDDHPYTVDGAPSAYILDTDGDGTIGKDANGNADPSDKAYLFFGLRRGGNAYYALDVTNPDAPSLLWTIDNTGDFSELGMSFSSPRVGTVQYGDSATPVIIFAGGYDPDKDSGHADDSEGNAIYVVHAETGALVWKATYGAVTGSQSSTLYHHSGMVDSIPSDLAALDTNADGNIDRLYVGDTGGTVWRVDMPEGETDTRDDWFASELANLGRDDINPVTNSNDRRFFHRPDFVPSSDSLGAFDGVLIGSGNRAAPRDVTTSNWFYLIKDRDIVTGSVTTSPFNHVDFDTDTNPQGLGDITDTCINATSCTADLDNGWKMQLEQPGEKVLAPALTTFGTVFFTSFLPEGNTAEAGTPCAPTEGAGRLYAVKITDGAPANGYDSTDGDPNNLTKSDRYDNLSSGGIPAEVVPIGNFILPPDLNPQSTGGRAFWKTFWYEKDVDNF
ncbi:MAG: PilC/PilY family type IV pilus protein [Pseudohongiellaceae bacterium]